MGLLKPLPGGKGYVLVEQRFIYVQDKPASMLTTVLLRNTTWVSAAEHPSMWGCWLYLTIAEHQMQEQDAPTHNTAGPSSNPSPFQPQL